MKVLLVNGSSRKNGCTDTALTEVERALRGEGIETEQYFIGNDALTDCLPVANAGRSDAASSMTR